jgi:hypothetical protein
LDAWRRRKRWRWEGLEGGKERSWEAGKVRSWEKAGLSNEDWKCWNSEGGKERSWEAGKVRRWEKSRAEWWGLGTEWFEGAKVRRLEGRGSDVIFKLIEYLNFRHFRQFRQFRYLSLLSYPKRAQ